MGIVNRSYSLIETPEQEAIARLLCNNDDYSTRMAKYSEYIGGPVTPILMCRHNRWDVGFVANGQSGPGERIPFSDLILQGLGADGVQAVRALFKTVRPIEAEMIRMYFEDCTVRCDSCGCTHSTECERCQRLHAT